MEQVSIEMMNEVICQFMELKGEKRFLQVAYTLHTDWNLLMAVVEKIEILGYAVAITGKKCSISKDDLLCECVTSTANWETKILTVFQAVYSFSKWYNQNKQQ